MRHRRRRAILRAAAAQFHASRLAHALCSRSRRRWARQVCARADVINAEPPPEQPPYPHALKSELQRCYGSKTDTKTLWRAGGWMHQKRVAAAATLAQERGRPFSSTGFEVAPRVIAPERSVLPGEQLATAAVVEKLDSGVLAAVAVERSAANPQLFNDDNDVTKRNVRGTVVDAAAALRRSEAHDAKVRSKYPQVTRGAHRHPITSTHVSPAHIVPPPARRSPDQL